MIKRCQWTRVRKDPAQPSKGAEHIFKKNPGIENAQKNILKEKHLDNIVNKRMDRDGKVNDLLQSIQWMIGSIELCGGLHFRTILLPCSDFTLTFFSFCWVGGTKGRQARKKYTPVSLCRYEQGDVHKHLYTHLLCYVETSWGNPHHRST